MNSLNMPPVASPLTWACGVAALTLFTASRVQAQTGQSQGTPGRNGVPIPGTAHPGSGGTKTPATIPHPLIATPHPLLTAPHTASGPTTTVHPGTTTPAATTPTTNVIVISPTTTTSPTTETSPTATRLTLPAYHPPTSLKTNASLGSGSAYNPVSVQPAINTNPYYQLQLQNGLPSSYLGGSLGNPYPGSTGGYNPWNPYGIYSNPFNPLNPYSLYNSSYRNLLGSNALLAVNPVLFNPYEMSLLGPALGSGLMSPLWNSGSGLFNGPFGRLGLGLGTTATVAVQQPGFWINEGPNLAVNPVSGTVVQPLSGYATMADGSTFYRLPTGITNTRSPVYYNPLGGTFYNPQTGVVAQPIRFVP